MSYRTNSDNIYAEGTMITAKENPSLSLRITKYYQRIYYCAIAGDEEKKRLAYFERELVPPVKLNEPKFQLTTNQRNDPNH